jgi:hypothetical protein
LLRRAGRQRNLAATAAKIRASLGSQQLTARPGVVPGVCGQRISVDRGFVRDG